MPKQIKEIKDFSGGLNTKHDSKDIKDNEFIEAKGVMFDKPGRLRVSRRSEIASDGTSAIPEYTAPIWNGSGAITLESGYGLGFINTDSKVDRVRVRVTAGNAGDGDTSGPWLGKYISPRAAAHQDNWLSGGDSVHTVFRVVEFKDNGGSPDYVY